MTPAEHRQARREANVRYRLRQQGVEVPSPPARGAQSRRRRPTCMTPAARRLLERLTDEHRSQTAIALEMGVSRQAVSEWLGMLLRLGYARAENPRGAVITAAGRAHLALTGAARRMLEEEL